MDYFTELDERPNSKTNRGIKYSWVMQTLDLGVNILTLVLTLVIFFIVIVCVRDAAATLSDVRAVVPEAARSLGDLEELLPEVKKTLSLVQNICDAPQFRDYCEPPL